ncbi:hypothetical protein DFQ28_007139 [Apophysomyces sp. BC1034]|nr:hypothetical protein DFQ30_007067 [Apophysomyces sp. BC1015]KAG0176585.1 hypothetical protein DFQ29_005951 [Apophysomyces sp. BC1021]KAG0186927.1 hypothetical protein DFQ28_007139 [Apophysomyces sp. BC1034]
MANSQPDLPATMHALQLVAYGPAQETLKYVETKTPRISRPEDVLVQVKAIGVNPIETKLRSGNIWGVSLTLPAVIGSDFSGIVVERGEKVSALDVGDEVYGSIRLPFGLSGTYAEYVVVSTAQDAIAKKPDHMSFEEAAAAGIASLTAYEGLVKQGNLSADHPAKLLVVGASGGVGSYAIQMGKALGATVVGICSGKNAEFVSQLGAERVVNYQSPEAMEQLVQEKDSYDVVLDCVGGESYFEKFSPLLRKSGIYSTAVGPVQHVGSEKLGFLDILKMGSKLSIRKLFGRYNYKIILSLTHKDFATKVNPFFANRLIRSVVLENNIIDLKDGAKAHELSETHRTVGKIVLRV